MKAKSGDGGCSQPCTFVLPCGHKCPRKCHPQDDHATFAGCKCKDGEEVARAIESLGLNDDTTSDSNIEPEVDDTFK
ncbi:hypothetical protein WR25_15467 [Diploscapter pachys]|uniref:Uncharacterized protein n=1 Tax=Diploscapter pachys TaxID=2018661 RepID=A0A2A2KXJ6_9BILA|nr:hypothetical protein WR25_15467 [Diploscapter pachys]